MLFILLGPLEIIARVIAIVIEATGSSIDKIVGYTLGITLIVAGILFIVAGLRRHRGGWRTLAGSLSCILAFPALAANVNAYLVPDYVARFDVKLAALCLVVGLLVLYFGQKHHVFLSENEGLRDEDQSDSEGA
jgi:Ca2+/Na+ antiporter